MIEKTTELETWKMAFKFDFPCIISTETFTDGEGI